MRTQGPRSSAIIKELAAVLPLTPFTIQVRFYALRLHTRIAERDRRQELAIISASAKRASGPTVLPRGHFLWDAVVDGHKQRWALDMPYGTLAETISPGSQIHFEERQYEAVRVYYSTLVVRSTEAGVDSLSGTGLCPN